MNTRRFTPPAILIAAAASGLLLVLAGLVALNFLFGSPSSAHPQTLAVGDAGRASRGQALASPVETGLPEPVATIAAHARQATAVAASLLLTPTPLPRTNGVQVVAQRDFGSWSYTARTDPHAPGVVAAVSYDRDSVAGLLAYAQANRALVAQIIPGNQAVEVNVVFRTYLAPDTFRAWVAAHKLQVNLSTLRLQDPAAGGGDPRTTSFINGTPADPLPAAALNEQTQPAQRGAAAPRLLGVVESRVAVPVSGLAGLLADRLVFFVDVTPVIVQQDLAARGIAGGAQAEVHNLQVFWYMENQGLAHFEEP